MRFSFTLVNVDGMHDLEKIGAKYPELVEISHSAPSRTINMTIDDGPAAAKIAVSVADKILSVHGEPFHVSDHDNYRLVKLDFPDKTEFSTNPAKELAELLMVECGRFFGRTETICYDDCDGVSLIGIIAATFQRRRELMVACISYMNGRFFQNSPIQIAAENSSFFSNMTLPFNYSSLTTAMPEKPACWSDGACSDCLVLDIWDNAESASLALTPENYERAMPYLRTLGKTVKVASYMDKDQKNHRIILRARTAPALAEVIDYLAGLHELVAFSLIVSAKFGAPDKLGAENAGKLPAMLVNTFRPFYELVGFKEPLDGILWVIVRNCKSNLTTNIRNLRRYVIHFYNTAIVRHIEMQWSERAVIEADAEGVFIMKTTRRGLDTGMFCVGLPRNVGRFPRGA